MVKKLPKSAFYSIKSTGNFYSAMRRDVELLRANGCYTTCTTVIMCCLDAIAAGTGNAESRKFAALVSKHFPTLCDELNVVLPSKPGADLLYDKFRNGFAHLRGPKSGFAIAESGELEGRYAGEVEVDGLGKFVAINVDRLVDDFLVLVTRLEEGAA